MDKTQLKTFYIGVKGVVVNPSKKKALVLVKKDQTGKAYFDIPGGRIDSNEDIQTTLVRELKEEILNIKNFKVGKLLNAYRLSRDLNDGYGLVLLYYYVESEIQEIQLSKEHSSYRWVSLEEIDSLDGTDETYLESGYALALKLALENLTNNLQ